MNRRAARLLGLSGAVSGIGAMVDASHGQSMLPAVAALAFASVGAALTIVGRA